MDKEQIQKLFEKLSEKLRRRRTRAHIYVFGGVAIMIEHQRTRTTKDMDVRIVSGHGATIDAAREIAREEGLPDNWLNEQGVSAIPRTKDRRAPVLFESPYLLITGASKEHLIAMKMEAARPVDIEDLSILLNKGDKIDLDRAVSIHESLLPDSRQKSRARAAAATALREGRSKELEHNTKKSGNAPEVRRDGPLVQPRGQKAAAQAREQEEREGQAEQRTTGKENATQPRRGTGQNDQGGMQS